MEIRPFEIRVACHAGSHGEEVPQRFYLGERRIEAEEVVDAWLAPDHRYFKVRGDDGAIYILRHDIPRQCWELTLFDSGSSRVSEAQEYGSAGRRGKLPA